MKKKNQFPKINTKSNEKKFSFKKNNNNKTKVQIEPAKEL